jgi:hypothetical protein
MERDPPAVHGGFSTAKAKRGNVKRHGLAPGRGRANLTELTISRDKPGKSDIDTNGVDD